MPTYFNNFCAGCGAKFEKPKAVASPKSKSFCRDSLECVQKFLGDHGADKKTIEDAGKLTEGTYMPINLPPVN